MNFDHSHKSSTTMQPLKSAKRFITIAGFAHLSIACGPPHVAPFTPRKRAYEVGEYAKRADSRETNGSLFNHASGGFLEDTRAGRVGDFVVIKIDEAADAEGGTSTQLKKASSGSGGISALLGIVPALKRAYPGMDPEKLFEYASKSEFSGDGNTTRKGALSGNVAVRVVREMPNGDLFLEGTKVVLINNEEYHLYLSGLARPVDIATDNTISSSRIADAQIEFTGRGDLADQQRKGWFSRTLDALNPF